MERLLYTEAWAGTGGQLSEPQVLPASRAKHTLNSCCELSCLILHRRDFFFFFLILNQGYAQGEGK